MTPVARATLALLPLVLAPGACNCIPPNASDLEVVAAVITEGDLDRALVSVCFPGHHSYAGAWDTWVEVNGAEVPWHSTPGAIESVECVGNGGWIDWDRTPEVRVGLLLEDDGADLDVVLDPMGNDDDDARTASWGAVLERDIDVSGVPETLRRGDSFTVPVPAATSLATILPDNNDWIDSEQVDANGEVVFNDPDAVRFTITDEMPLGFQRVTLGGQLDIDAESCEGFVECTSARVDLRPRALSLTIE